MHYPKYFIVKTHLKGNQTNKQKKTHNFSPSQVVSTTDIKKS